MSDRTELRQAGVTHGRDSEGREGMPKVGTA
jgi:hypothetical protein